MGAVEKSRKDVLPVKGWDYASSLLNDVLLQLRKQRTGIYRSPDEFTLD